MSKQTKETKQEKVKATETANQQPETRPSAEPEKQPPINDDIGINTDESSTLSEEQLLEIIKAEFTSRIASLEAENASLKDQYLRKAAEFENFRRRLQRDKQDAVEFANQSLLLDLIPIIDDFERAIQSSEKSRDYDSFHEGVSLIAKQLLSMLNNKWGLVRYESLNQPFDPNRHEAIMMEKSPKVLEPTVIEDFYKGFLLKERVIRCAKVKVAMPLEETTTIDEASDETEAD